MSRRALVALAALVLAVPVLLGIGMNQGTLPHTHSTVIQGGDRLYPLSVGCFDTPCDFYLMAANNELWKLTDDGASGSLAPRVDYTVHGVDFGTPTERVWRAWIGQVNVVELVATPTAFASLGAPGDGTISYCSDCTFANPCAGGGTGAIAKRLNGAWRCD